MPSATRQETGMPTCIRFRCPICGTKTMAVPSVRQAGIAIPHQDKEIPRLYAELHQLLSGGRTVTYVVESHDNPLLERSNPPMATPCTASGPVFLASDGAYVRATMHNTGFLFSRVSAISIRALRAAAYDQSYAIADMIPGDKFYAGSRRNKPLYYL